MIGTLIDDWTPRRADHWAEWTDRQALGCVVSHARIVGSRSHDALMADRERRMEEARQRAVEREAEALWLSCLNI